MEPNAPRKHPVKYLFQNTGEVPGPLWPSPGYSPRNAIGLMIKLLGDRGPLQKI